jgi:integrase/recombinase XerD
MSTAKRSPIRLREALLATVRARWAGRPTEEELYGRASRVAEILRGLQGVTDLPVDAITTATLAEVQRRLLQDGRTPATVNRTMSAFGTVLRHAKDAGIQVAAMPPRLREGGRSVRALTDEEFELIHGSISDLLTMDLVAFMRYTGLRVSEALRLTREDFAPDLAHVTVRRAKSGAIDRLPLHSGAQVAIRMALTLHTPGKGTTIWNDLTYPAMLADWKDAVRTALGSYDSSVGPHALRRTFATWLHRKGTPIRVIQRFLGHRSVTTTERYIAVSEDDMLKALEG